MAGFPVSPLDTPTWQLAVSRMGDRYKDFAPTEL
jgi:hypothetical protein